MAPTTAQWTAGVLFLPDGTTAVDRATAAGLPLVRAPDPLGAHTYAPGQIIAAALDHDCDALLTSGVDRAKKGSRGAGNETLAECPHCCYRADERLAVVGAIAVLTPRYRMTVRSMRRWVTGGAREVRGLFGLACAVGQRAPRHRRGMGS
ncbi:glycerate kinase [Micromonospora sp. LZ34]